ncbi:MAG TPA: Uma2 family endonuclease [Ginsengibacter sp.]
MRRGKEKIFGFRAISIVEILSPSTALRDRHTKYELYQQQGVKYYLIVDADTKNIEVYMLHDEQYSLQPMNSSYTFELKDNCSITPDMSTIFD